jgi:hypothetical protein
VSQATIIRNRQTKNRNQKEGLQLKKQKDGLTNKANISFVLFWFSVGLGFAWIAWFCYLFFGNHTHSWARGEAGDFLGGGLGAISVIFIAYALFLQIKQNQDVFEAGVFRTFETLKPELEGLSVRIISKTFEGRDTFDEMFEKYRKGDRTVFLREMQKKSEEILSVSKTNLELKDAMERYKKMMVLLDSALKKTEKNDDGDFSEAIKQTEVYRAYEACFPNHQ